jgi:hypothetical protein
MPGPIDGMRVHPQLDTAGKPNNALARSQQGSVGGMARRYSSEDLSEIQAIKLEAELIRFSQNENGVSQ